MPKDNAMAFLSEDGGETYNRCHFWSNFEIGSLALWRSEAYLAYFEYLDKAGGFFYERWGDAPVHSIAAALFLVCSQHCISGKVADFAHLSSPSRRSTTSKILATGTSLSSIVS